MTSSYVLDEKLFHTAYSAVWGIQTTEGLQTTETYLKLPLSRCFLAFLEFFIEHKSSCLSCSTSYRNTKTVQGRHNNNLNTFSISSQHLPVLETAHLKDLNSRLDYRSFPWVRFTKHISCSFLSVWILGKDRKRLAKVVNKWRGRGLRCVNCEFWSIHLFRISMRKYHATCNIHC